MRALEVLEGLLPGTKRTIFRSLLASGDHGLPVDELAAGLAPSSVASNLGLLTSHRLVTRHRIGGEVVYLANAEAVLAEAGSLTESCPRRIGKPCDFRCAAVMTSLADLFGGSFRVDCPLIAEARSISARGAAPLRGTPTAKTP